MNLVEACEPLFQYVCMLSRTARKGGSAAIRPDAVRAELKARIADSKVRADKHPELVQPFRQIEPVLHFFADSMVRGGKIKLGFAYDPISKDLPQPELAFEAKFWEM